MKRKILPLLLAVVLVVAAMVPMFAISAAADGNGAWTLVTDVNDLAVGDKIVLVARDHNYAMSTTQNTNNRGVVAVTKDKTNNTVSWTTAVQEIQLTEGTVAGTFGFNVGSGYLYAASSSKNYLKTQSTNNANGSWKITIAADGTATIVAQGSYTRNIMRYNPNISNGNPLVSCYNSSTDVKDVFTIYKYVEAGSSEPDTTECEHTNKQLVNDANETFAPTCTEKGQNTYTCPDCSETIVEPVNATGHQNTTTDTTEATCEETGLTIVTCKDCKTEVSRTILPTAPHNYVDGVCEDCGAEMPAVLTLVFDNTNKCTSSSNEQQIWQENGIIFINDKNESGTNVAVNAPIRCYQGSAITIKIAAGNITKIVVTCDTNKTTYPDDLQSSINNASVSVDGLVVTITPNASSDTYTIAKLARQVRIASIDVYYAKAECAHENTTTTTVDATCTVPGSTTVTCDDCDALLSSTKLIVNHVVVNGACTSGCGVTVEEFFGQVSTEGKTLDGTYTLTGVITGFYASGSSTGEYDATYENVSVIIDIDGTDTNFVCYRMKGTGADVIKVGDTITATGTITNYKGTIEFTQDCTLDSYVPAPVTEFDAASMLISNDLTLNYIVKAPADVIDTLTVKFEFNGETYTVVGKPLEDGRVQFSLVGIAPQQIKLNVKAELYAGEELVDKVAEYSIAKYIERTLANNPTAELKALLESVTAYSKAADNYLAGTPGAITEETAPEINSFAGEKPTDENNRIYAGGVRFDYLNSIYVKVKAENAGNIAVFDSEGEKIKYDVLPYADGYIVYVQVKPTEFNKVFTFTVGTKHSVTYSVNSYIYAMWNNAEVGELARATYNFGVAANAYKVANEDAFVKNN